MNKYSNCKNYLFYKRLHCQQKEGLLRIYFEDRNGVIYSWMPRWKEVTRIFWRAFKTEVEYNQAKDITPFKRTIRKIFNYFK